MLLIDAIQLYATSLIQAQRRLNKTGLVKTIFHFEGQTQINLYL